MSRRPLDRRRLIAAYPAGGDTINIAANTYTEQQLIINKCLTITGAGQGLATIQSPATLTNSTSGGVNAQSVIEIRANSYVTVSGLTVKGTIPSTGIDVYGIFVIENSTLNMSGASCDIAIGNVSAASYLILSQTTASAASVSAGGTATIETSLRFNSLGTDTFTLPGNPHLPNPIPSIPTSANSPNGILVNFSVPAYGTVSPAAVSLIDGRVKTSNPTAPFTGGTVNGGDQTAVIKAKVDNAEDTVNVTVLDATAPMVVSATGSLFSPNVVNYTVTFSENVTGVDATDFSLATVSGNVVASVTVVSGSDNTRTAQITVASGMGTIRLNVVDNDSIKDTASAQNALGGAGAGNGNFMGTPFNVDVQMPTVTINQASGQADPTNVSTINFTVVFNEPVTGFNDLTDVTLSGAAAGATVSSITPVITTTYTVAVSGMTSSGTVIVAIVPANKAIDGDGNGNAASTSTDNSVLYDNNSPTIVSITGSPATDTTSPIDFTVVFSEPVMGFTAGDVVITGTAFTTGTPVVIITGGATTYNVSVSGMNQTGTVVASIGIGAVIDLSANQNTNSASGGVQFNPASNPVLVSPADTKGWTFLQETVGTASGTFVTGPSMPNPLTIGSGSARLAVDAAAGEAFIDAKPAYAGVRFDQITNLSYSTYQTVTNAGTISFQFNLETDVNAPLLPVPGNGGFQGRLVYEPIYDPAHATVQTGAWQNWNAMSPTAVFWASPSANTTVDNMCPQGNTVCTRAFLLTNFPNLGLRAFTPSGPPAPQVGVILFKIGGGIGAPHDGNVDNFVFGVNSATTTFNFEATPPDISIDTTTAVSVTEGNGVTTTTATFTVSLSQVSQLNTTVLVSTADGSAMTADSDYVALVNQLVTIPAGSPSTTFGVTVNGDNVYEPNETFTVSLSNAVNAAIVGSPVTGTIINDEAPRTLSIANTTPGAEPGTANVFTVTLSGQTASPVTVAFATANGTATAEVITLQTAIR